MEENWMGRYHELVGALICFSNASSRCGNTACSTDIPEYISHTEYQILGYICEFEDGQKIMADISRDLGILPSIITKTTKHLHKLGYIEKYHIQGNKKSIILRPTDAGKAVFNEYLVNILKPAYRNFFDALGNISDEDLKAFENALKFLYNSSSETDQCDQRQLSKI